MPQQNIEFQRGIDTSWVFQNLIDGSNSPLPAGTCASLILEHVVAQETPSQAVGPGGNILGEPSFDSSLSMVNVSTSANPIPTDTVFYRMAYGSYLLSTGSGRSLITTIRYTTLSDSTNILPLYTGNRKIVSAPSSPTTGRGGFNWSNRYITTTTKYYMFTYLHTNDGNKMPSLYTFSINHSTGTVRLNLTALGTLNNSSWSSLTHPLGAAYAKRWDAYGFPGFNNVEQRYELVLNIPDGNKIRRVVGAYGTFKTLDRWTLTTQSNIADAIDCPVLPSGTGIL